MRQINNAPFIAVSIARRYLGHNNLPVTPSQWNKDFFVLPTPYGNSDQVLELYCPLDKLHQTINIIMKRNSTNKPADVSNKSLVDPMKPTDTLWVMYCGHRRQVMGGKGWKPQSHRLKISLSIAQDKVEPNPDHANTTLIAAAAHSTYHQDTQHPSYISYAWNRPEHIVHCTTLPESLHFPTHLLFCQRT